MTARAEVLFANQVFYEAFRARDLATMDQLWAREAAVACIHPGWQALTTREAVMASWRDILGNPEAPAISCRNAEAFVTGETALVICYEAIGEGVLVATNLFVYEAGSWKLIHHHAGPCDLSPAALDEEDAPGPVQ